MTKRISTIGKSHRSRKNIGASPTLGGNNNQLACCDGFKKEAIFEESNGDRVGLYVDSNIMVVGPAVVRVRSKLKMD